MTKTLTNKLVKKIVKQLRKEGVEPNHTNYLIAVAALLDVSKAQLSANKAWLDNSASWDK